MSFFDDNEDMIIFGRTKPAAHNPHLVTCKHCGTRSLTWENFGAGFSLYDADFNKHMCLAGRPSADDFDILP